VLVKVQRHLAKCFSLLSLSGDKYFEQIFENLGKITNTLAHSNDPTIKLNALIMLGNLARSDESCKKLLDNGVCDLVLPIVEAFPNDQRIIHMTLAVLRNLSISESNRVTVASKGAISVAVTGLKTNSLLVQFEAIGLLKCLLTGVVPKDHYETFERLGGLPFLADIASTPPKPQQSSTTGKEEPADPRVMYEAARLVCRLCENGDALKTIGDKAAVIFKVLVASKYPLLQSEGACALVNLTAKNDDFLPAITAEVPELVRALGPINPSDQFSQTTPLYVLKLLAVIIEKGGKDKIKEEDLAVVREWASKNSALIKSEDLRALLSRLLQ